MSAIGGGEARFSGIARLLSTPGLARLRDAHVCVVGIGGVGSWAVEALARSGVGALSLVDLDDVCESNVNRQIHALDGSIGRPKVDVMAERVLAINPACRVHPVHAFVTTENADEVLARGFTHVLDAIDAPTKKALLISRCRARGVPVTTVGGAGGRRDPTAVRVCDLGRSSHDRLLAEVRRLLRHEHGFPREGDFDVPCVCSPEPVVYPRSDGTVCAGREPGSALRLDCESGYGTAAFVTGAFGLVAASVVVKCIAEAR